MVDIMVYNASMPKSLLLSASGTNRYTSSIRRFAPLADSMTAVVFIAVSPMWTATSYSLCAVIRFGLSTRSHKGSILATIRAMEVFPVSGLPTNSMLGLLKPTDTPRSFLILFMQAEDTKRFSRFLQLACKCIVVACKCMVMACKCIIRDGL